MFSKVAMFYKNVKYKHGLLYIVLLLPDKEVGL